MRWPAAYLLAALVAILLCGGYELFWRSTRLEPSLHDDWALWAEQRARVYTAGAVALLGDSRMLLGFDIPAFRERHPKYTVSQLAVDGQSPIATLVDLCNDLEFRGLVIMSFAPEEFLPSRRREQKSHVDAFRQQWNLYSRTNREIMTFLQLHLVSLSSHASLRNVLVELFEHGAISDVEYCPIYPDRFRPADYTLIDVAARTRATIDYHRRKLEEHGTVDPERWLVEALAVEAEVEKLLARGGKVVFLRMPTTGEHWDLDEKFFPRASFWDPFVARTQAVAIHFRDYPELQFECPDTSHLDRRHARPFTLALAELLVSRGVIEE